MSLMLTESKSLTELAICKERTAMEIRGLCLANSAVERDHADTLEREAAEILRLDDPPETGIGGEVTKPRVLGLKHAQAAGLESMRRRGYRITEDASIRRTRAKSPFQQDCSWRPTPSLSTCRSYVFESSFRGGHGRGD